MTTQRITAGVYLVDAPCPRCGALEEILVGIGTTRVPDTALGLEERAE